MVTKTKRKLKETNSAGPKIAPAGTTPAGTTPDANQPQSDLSIGDLRNLSTVIDVASTRGAFRANEMAMVGAVYNKLQAFLARVTPADDKKDNAEKTTIPTGAPIKAPATKK